MSAPLIRVEHVGKIFRQGFWMRRVEAVQDVSFEVSAGHIYGFLGPNGAGKTTTIKMLTGLIAPTSGRATVFGHDVSSHRAREKVGFLPENPYVYPYLSAREFVEMCGRLSGLGRRAARDRATTVLDQTGVLYAADRPVGKLSKGMLQRSGLAAALVADPELLILDEPMSGLDPVGRKEVRDIILEERGAGRTIFFSTHILSDVEMMCDHVTILRRGRVVVSGEMSRLLRSEVQRTDIALEGASAAFRAGCEARGLGCRTIGTRLVVEVQGQARVDQLLRDIVREAEATPELRLVSVTPHTETLEDLFMREAIGTGDKAAPAAPPS